MAGRASVGGWRPPPVPPSSSPGMYVSRDRGSSTPLLSLRDLSSLFDGRGVGLITELGGGRPVPATRRLTPPLSLQLGGCGVPGRGSLTPPLVAFFPFLKTKGFGPFNFLIF